MTKNSKATFQIGSTVSIVDDGGHHNARGKVGMTGRVTVLDTNPIYSDTLVTVILADKTETTMYGYRFKLVTKKVRKSKPKAENTKIAKLRKHFLSGKSLTQLEALGLYGAFRLAARVHDLKGEGMKIETRMKEDPNGNPYAEYQLRSPWVRA